MVPGDLLCQQHGGAGDHTADHRLFKIRLLRHDKIIAQLFSVFIHDLIGTVNDVSLCLLRTRKHFLQHLALPVIITIQQRYILAAAHVQSPIPGSACAHILLIGHQPYSGILLCQFLDDLPCPVLRTVVNDDQLPIRYTLRLYRGNGLPDVFLRVKGRHDHRHQRSTIRHILRTFQIILLHGYEALLRLF